MIYFVQPVEGGPVKIGYTDHLNARRRQLERHYGKPMVILATLDGGESKERELHERFAHLRVGSTEQFHPGPELIDFIGLPAIDPRRPAVSRTLGVALRPVKLHVDVIEAARIVAAYRNETMTDMLSEILRPSLAKLEREEVAKRHPGKPKGKGAKP